MTAFYLVVENLRIGGFQRITLDEAYQLSAQNIPVTIITLKELPINTSDSFEYIEKKYISRYGIKIINVCGSKYEQFKFFKSLIKENQDIIIWSHNLTATVLVRLARIGLDYQVKIATTIHQLPSLTDFRQRFKRYLYSMFSDRIFLFSAAAKNDWEGRLKRKGMLWLMNKKGLEILRNGIFMSRLPNKITYPELRIVYLGRNTKWKGIDIILELAEEPLLKQCELLFILPTKDLSFLSSIPHELLNRITIQAGTAFDSYVPRSGDIHLYPASYGPKAKYLESISINCLEMACVGIQSIVTKNGLGTWPEFKGSSLFIEVDWNNTQEVINSIINYKANDLILDEIDRIKNLVDIKLHVAKMIDAFK